MDKALGKIERLEKEIKEIDLVMSSDQIEYDELNSLFCKKQELSKELDTDMEFWLGCSN